MVLVEMGWKLEMLVIEDEITSKFVSHWEALLLDAIIFSLFSLFDVRNLNV